LEQNIAFKEQGRKELEKTRKEKLVPLQAQLSMAISAVAREHQLAVVVNTDSNACPYIDPELAIDLNDEVKQQLSKVNK
jgi:outer membrane protein